MAQTTCPVDDPEGHTPGGIYCKGLCKKHYDRQWRTGTTDLYRPTMEERFWSKVDRRSPSECWLWQAGHFTDGYGVFHVGDQSTGAHVIAYRIAYGLVPHGMEVDHYCHTIDLLCPGGRTCPHRGCVNPYHLQAVTKAENTRRGWARVTHCKHGHELTPENTYDTLPQLGRRCKICARRRAMDAYARRQARASEITAITP